MAACAQAFQNKRGRDECSNGGLASPEAKRTNSGILGYDNGHTTFIEKMENADNNDQETDVVNEVKLEVEMMLNGVIKSLEDEIGMKVKTDNSFESTDQNGSSDQMGSNKEGELIAEATNQGDYTYHDDVFADTDFFIDHITPDEFGIMMQSYLDQDSVPDIVYSGIPHEYNASTEASYGSMWEDDLWRLNEHPVIQSDFALSEQEDFGISGGMFHDVWN